MANGDDERLRKRSTDLGVQVGNRVSQEQGIIPGLAATYTAGAKSVVGDIGETFRQAPKVLPEVIPKAFETIPAAGPVMFSARAIRGAGEAVIGGLESLAGPPRAPEIIPTQTPRQMAAIEAISVAPETPPGTRTPLRTVGQEELAAGPGGGEGIIRTDIYPTEGVVRAPAGPTPSAYAPAATTGGGVVRDIYAEDVAKAQRDRAEYEQYLKEKELREVAGIDAGPERLRKHMESVEPYLAGLKRKDAAKLRATLAGQFLAGQEDLRKSYISGQMSRFAAGETAAGKVESQKIAAMARYQIEAQKHGINVAKLRLDEAKLGLQAADIDLKATKIMSDIKQGATADELKRLDLTLKAAKTVDEKVEAERRFLREKNYNLGQLAWKGWEAKYSMNPNAPEAIQAAEQIEASQNLREREITLLRPLEGQTIEMAPGKFAGWTGKKWVGLTRTEGSRAGGVIPEGEEE
jgi:hypothetical protein